MKEKTPKAPVQAIPGPRNAQKAKLASALRENLKHRKAAPRTEKAAKPQK